MSQTVTPQGGNQVRWASGINVIAGLWLIISPFVLSYTGLQGALWNDVILGIVIAALAAIRVAGAMDQPWLSWVNVVLGAWVIISAWVLGFVDTPAALWDNVIVGVIVLIVAAWSALASPVSTGRVMRS
jgi:SPW repeat